MKKVPAYVALPGAGLLQAKLSERDAELARGINQVADVFDFGAYNYPATRNIGWQDMIGNIEVRGVAGANTPTWSEITGMTGMYAYKFSATTMMEVWINFHLIHDYALGTSVYLHTHWINAAASPNTGTVRWGFQWTAAKGHSQQAFPATSTVYATQNCGATRYLHHIAEISTADAVAPTNLEPDSLILCRIFRDAANDTCTDDVYLLLADCHYQTNRFSTMNRSPEFDVPHVDLNISPQPGVLSINGSAPTVSKTP